jgi:uncharacterized protein (TIGR03435 family)
LPKWAGSARFDINATTASGTEAPGNAGFIDDDLRLALRTLLTERFQMKTHYEDRLVSAYSLVAPRPKLKKADAANRGHCGDARTVANDPRDLYPRLSRLVECKNTTMAQFAEQLQRLAPDYLASDVVDATGLSGGWDFTVSYTPSYQLLSTGGETAPASGLAPAASDPSGGISLFEAISGQLGLKLVMRKRRLPILVIDHMDQMPAAN